MKPLTKFTAIIVLLVLLVLLAGIMPVVANARVCQGVIEYV